MVTIYGMNDKIGNVSYYDSKQSDYSFTKPYSESTAQIIDQEVKKIISDAFERTKELLKNKREQLNIIATELLEKEIIFQTDLERLIGKRPFSTSTTYQAYTQKSDSLNGIPAETTPQELPLKDDEEKPNDLDSNKSEEINKESSEN
jgi:cell division protease FtsH